MSSVDQRVVEMQFKNSEFAKGISDTLSGLQKLQAGLKLDGASKGATDAAAGLNDLGNNTGLLGGKFTAMSAIALGALASIGAKAVAIGSQVANSFTFGPITSGFQEYELKMGSIQTILANTQKYGTTLPEVTSALDQLNHYADQTIYNFGDMTRNIGLFTNAGIRIEDATSMIQGFSNAAAASGTNAEGASHAAFQLSQALTTGTIRAQDWISLTNVGMGNKNMQESLVNIASAMGTFSGTSITAEDALKDVKGTLDEGWLSADVMSTYLKIMSGEMDDASISSLGLTDAQVAMLRQQAITGDEAARKVRTFTQLMGTLKEAVGSGWSETFGILIGDFNEATDLFTGISNTLGDFIGGMSASRNALLQQFKDLGGRTVVIEALGNVFRTLGSILSTIGSAFREIFPKSTAQDLLGMANSFKAFSEAIQPSEETLNNLKRTFAGLFAIVGIVWELIKAGAGFFFDLTGSMAGTGGGLLEITGNIGDFLVGLHEAIKSGDIFGKVFDGIAAGAQVAVRAFQAVVTWLGSLFDGIQGINLSGFGQMFDPMEEAGGRIATIFNKVVGALKTAASAVGNFVGMIIDWFSQLGDVFTGNGFEFDADTIMNALGIGLGGGVLLFLNSLKNAVRNFDIFGGMGGGFFDNAADALDNVNGVLGAMQTNLKASALLKIAGAIAILAAAVFVLAGIDAAGLARATGALTVMFVQLGGALAVFERIGSERQAAKLVIMSAGLILLSIAVLILTAAVKNLSNLSWEELAKGLLGLTVMLAALAGTVQLMSGSDVKMIRTGAGLILLAVAIKILVSAVGDLIQYNWEQLARGLVGVGVMLAALALFTRFAEADSGGIKQGLGLILLALAIKLLASAVGDFIQYNWEELARGMAGIGVGLALITAAMNLIPADGNIGKAIAVGVIAFALGLLADSLGKFVQFNWEELARGMSAIGVGLGIITAALMLIPTGSIFSAAAILIVAVSLGILADALKQMAGMSWEELAKGLTGMAVALGVIAIALNFMVGTLAGAAALLVVAAALTVLVPVLQQLGAMSIGDLVQALIGLAAVFAVLGVAGLLLAPVAVVLLAVGAAIFLLGAGVILAAAGILLFSTALVALSVAGAAGLAAFGALLALFLAMLPGIFTALGEAIVAFANVIAEGAPAIIGAFVALLTALLNAIIEMTPLIAETLLTLLLTLFDIIRAALPQMIQLGFDILMGFLTGIANNIGNVVDTAVDIIVNLLDGIARNLPRIIESGTNLVIQFIQGLSSAIPQVVQAGLQMIVDVANGIANAIGDVIPQLIDAAGNIASAIIDGIVDGIGNLASRAWNAVTDMASGLLDSAMDFLGINSPSKEFMYIGQYVSQGMAVGIDNHAYRAERSAEAMGSDVIRTMGKTIEGLDSMISGMDEMNPVITPILDLSEVRRGSGAIGDILGDTPLQVGDIRANASSADSARKANLDELADILDQRGSTNITMNQVNNSPKALSQAEIYRRTNNQISKVKEALT